jgi:hypothetical protein
MREAFGEINELTEGRLRTIEIDPSTNKVTIAGYDREGILRSDKWELREYIKTARQYRKVFDRLEREKAKYGVTDSYNYERLDELVMKSSRTVNGRLVARGLTNRIETIKKVLTKDKETGLSKLEQTQRNLMELRKLKYESYDDPDSYMKRAGLDISKFKKKNGEFRSKKAEREYLKLFSQTTVDEDYENSGEFADFFGFVFDNYVDIESKETTKSVWNSKTKDEQREIMREYIREREAELKVDFDEEAELGIRRTLLGGKRR